MLSRTAVIDLGTNTFHLLIAEPNHAGAMSVISRLTIPVKLGENNDHDGGINDLAVQRALAAVEKFKEIIDRDNPSEIRAVATSAFRTSKNGKDVLKQITKATGISPMLISGEEEARLIYEGVSRAVNISGASLIMDIGGGSVEFIICDENGILWKNSYPIGAARLLGRFFNSDPLSDEDISSVEHYLSEHLEELRTKVSQFKPDNLIGSAGAFETFAELADPPFSCSFEQPEYTFNLEEYFKIAAYLLASNHKQRSEMAAIPPVRVDMILMATLITNYVLSFSGINNLRLSAYSLKEGLLFGSPLKDQG